MPPYRQVTNVTTSGAAIATRYFDEQGNEVVPAGAALSATEAVGVIYHVNTRIATSTQLTELTRRRRIRPGVPPATPPAWPPCVVQVAFNPGNLDLSPTLNNFLWVMSGPQYRGIALKTYCAQVGRND